ncbi:MAG: hypothetical protein JHC22_06990 [Thermoproteus sp.]|nr:hypothetical protein [Thermoproteus sp.]
MRLLPLGVSFRELTGRWTAAADSAPSSPREVAGVEGSPAGLRHLVLKSAPASRR